MDEPHTQAHAYVHIDGKEFHLGPSRDLVALMDRIETAAHSGPAFVDISGDETMLSVLIGPRSQVVVAVRNETTPQPPGDVDPPAIDWEL